MSSDSVIVVGKLRSGVSDVVSQGLVMDAIKSKSKVYFTAEVNTSVTVAVIVRRNELILVSLEKSFISNSVPVSTRLTPLGNALPSSIVKA